jgi:hypothetical protein
VVAVSGWLAAGEGRVGWFNPHTERSAWSTWPIKRSMGEIWRNCCNGLNPGWFMFAL